MRHRVAHRKLGRVTEHRIALLRNQATALIRYEHITTTVPKAKELRPFVEKLITVAKRGRAAGTANAKELNARRMVMQDIQDREIVSKLFDTIAVRFETRPGGYTRLIRLGSRRGDAAEMAQVEFIGSEFDPKAKDAAKEGGEAPAPKQKGVGGRLKAAAERLRGKRDEEGTQKPSTKPSKGAGRKSTAPRKTGGGG